MKKTLILIAVLFSSSLFATRADFIAREFCQKDSRLKKNYCLEMMEFAYRSPFPKKGTVLLIPGFFQNVNIWHLDPEKGVSVARYLMEKFGLHPFVLHVRGIGHSDYVKDSNMDDIAIDDIPRAIDELSTLSGGPIYVMGHSQGAITAAASLSGLTRCGKKNCFKPEVAELRQSKVKKLAMLAGNLAMSIDREDNFLLPLMKLADSKILRSTLRAIDEIDVKLVTSLTGPVAFLNYWENLYLLENAPDDSRRALWKKSVDTSSAEIVIQFAEGIENRNIQCVGGTAYSKGAENLKLPVVQQTYDQDELAEWEATRRDTFEHIGSQNKKFLLVKNRAHEDFFMNKNLHSDLDSVVEFLYQ
ncbi:MAG: hypothetical protein COV37_14445 [Bdellovibrio sp. CG11_big_fil_rev_8_21_14_0_20_39_38]|nr:MAG: hypothetical protein COW78_05050 [Bdellovibrio sp. CG22_combo_CG10-13_8_21_14_all_39_27]PIR33914.1 MAG: hypothetical protein COV37_14445 [Bdellovibrio sp. CG11_big_fil_rev_8_21_14_0_20_39_38]PJB54678.1 MAG: hypothetical protein CO099_00220 [Bdellovibrio sp. CG_4_9_14_3_um_filter_39_7]